jgi:predicted Fe-Mo cluster-binding NifX family protein
MVPSQGVTLDSPVAPVLGTAPYFILADTTIGTVVTVLNGSWASPAGASSAILAFTQERQVNIVLAARIDPKLFGDLQAAQVRMYYLPGPMTVSQAVADYLAGSLPPATEAVVEQGFGRAASARWLQPW